MIIVKIKGGLGNQLFQYAIGLELSKINKRQLYLDLSWFKNNKTDTIRNFMLDKFQIYHEIATEDLIKKFNNQDSVLQKIINRLSNIFLPIRFRKYIIEIDNNFNNEILLLKDNFYLDGTWMNEKYFSTVKEDVRKLYSIKPFLNNYYKKIESNILYNNSICVHIRRGDYANNPDTLKYHGLIPFDYYLVTMKYFSDKFKDAKFYLFSDDIEWVKSIFKNNSNICFVSNDFIDSDIQEFYLMSKCKHHVIANSTFSWWSAWLSNNPQKIVCAPKRWSSKILDSKCLVPSNWITFNF